MPRFQLLAICSMEGLALLLQYFSSGKPIYIRIELLVLASLATTSLCKIVYGVHLFVFLRNSVKKMLSAEVVNWQKIETNTCPRDMIRLEHANKI